MQGNGTSDAQEILSRLNQLLHDTNCRIKRVHGLMDRVYRHFGDGDGEADLNQEDGWRIII
ncbi:MAG: hypothetical protein JSV03_10455 [Planctomycetota bacterium]|nr:MAG: hypothetical protein JSV03_10455 [Planctomycetota bacterium]